MARTGNDANREAWYRHKLDNAPTPKGKLHLLQGKLIADIDRLPPENRQEVLESAIEAVQALLDDVAYMRVTSAWTA